MSISLIPVITAAGLQAVLSAHNDGLQATITHIALGDGGHTPTTSAITLQHERHRVAISNFTRLQSTQLHMTAIENGANEYWVREVGFFLSDGTLLAIWSHPTQALAWKANDVDLLIAFDMVLSALPPDSVTVIGSGGVNLAPATDTHEGVVRLANLDEVQAGLSATVVMTPAGVRAHGDARYAPRAHAHDWNSIENKPGNFRPEAHVHRWQELNDIPSSFPPEVHQHEWDEIANRPTTFRPDLHDHDGRYLQATDLVISSGFVQTTHIASAFGWVTNSDFEHNYVDIYPPNGFTMAHFQGVIASTGLGRFAPDVNGDVSLWCRWQVRSECIRVISTSNFDVGSYINYLAVWRR